MKPNFRLFRVNIFIFLLALAGTLAIFFCAQKWGIGFDYDSPAYIDAAKNMSGGKGLSVPSGHGALRPLVIFAPLYSILLSLISKFHIDPVRGALLLNAFLFGANIFLVGFIVAMYIPRSFLPPVFASFLILSSGSLLRLHSVVMTEGLFIFFGILGLFLLADYIRGRNFIFLIISSILIALAFLTRYAGVSFVAAGIIGLLFLAEKPFNKKLNDCFIFFSISSLPIGVWFIRNLHAAGSATDKKFAFHPITTYNIKIALSVISEWLLPNPSPPVMKYIFLSAVIVSFSILLFYWARKNKHDKCCLIPSLYLVFIIVYVVFLVMVCSFFDAFITLDERILSPVFIALVILILSVVYDTFISARRPKSVRFLAILLCIAFSVSYLFYQMKEITSIRNNGMDLTGRLWKESVIIQKVRELKAGIKIYSNAPPAIYTLTGRFVEWLPLCENLFSGSANSEYLSEIAQMQKEIGSQQAVLVWFDITDTPEYPQARKAFNLLCDWIRESDNGIIVEQYKDGNIIRKG